MNPGITEWLSEEQIQSFDIDSIKEVLDNYKKTKELNNFDLDWNNDLSIEEINIYNKIKDSENIIDNLESLITQIKSIGKKEDSWLDNIFSDNESISSKDINDYTKEEASKVLKFLNNNYKNYDEAISKSADEFAENFSSTDTLDDIGNKTEVNIFQQKLINKILWNENWFSWEYLQWYNNEKWNFIEDTWKFMSDIKTIDIKNINSLSLINYFKLLTNDYKINIYELKILFWEKQLVKLKNYWESDKSNNIAKNYLIENWLWYIIELMDKDLDYYSSLSGEELKQKIKNEFKWDENSIEYKKKIAQINTEIIFKQLDENKKVLKWLWYTNKQLEEIENNYNQKLKNELKNNKKLDKVFIRLNTFNEYNNHLQLIIEWILEKKVWTKDILDKYWIDFSEEDIVRNGKEIDFLYNIKTEDLLNKLINISDINENILIISELTEADLLDNSFNHKNKLIDLYLKKITNEWTINQKTQLIKNLPLFRSQNLCPSPNVVIELRKSIIINNTMENYIKNEIDKLYPKWNNLWEELIKEVEYILNNSKEWKKYCTIDIAKIIIEFDAKHINEKNNPVPLTKEQIKNLINWSLKLEKEQINNEIWSILLAGWFIESLWKEESNKYKELPTLWKDIINSNLGYSYNNNLTLRLLTIEKIENNTKLSKVQKEILIKRKHDLEIIDKKEHNLYSFTDKEFNKIIEWIKNGKTTEEIEKEIEKEKNKITKLKWNQNSENTNKYSSPIETYQKIASWYKLIWDNWKPIEWLIISEEEKNIINNNKEAKENIINFYNTLKKLWLSNLWKYRSKISNAIWTTNWINNNDNSLSSNELQIFLNSILKSVGKKEIKPQADVNQYINLFKIQNNYQVIWDWYKDTSNKIWNSNIEEMFMKKYIIWYSKFQTTLFKKDLKNENK